MGKHGSAQACGTCGGRGWVKVSLDGKEKTITCGSCNGTGKA
ncbi:YuiA family protein [Actinomadura opuntiae]|nr:YuiA family protein [Actinomadura sp. OS1-43]MDL4818425.1 YuiA family protein [Actinomadura sp. OS1-43]